MDKKLNALKAEHWKQVLHRYNLARQETGISKTEWCNQNGIGVKSLYRWQKALRLEAAEQLLPVQQDIVPVEVASCPQSALQPYSAAGNTTGEITFGKNGIIIRMPTVTPPEYLLALVKGLC